MSNNPFDGMPVEDVNTDTAPQDIVDKPKPFVAPECGLYKVDDAVFRVKQNQLKTRVYAERWDQDAERFIYDRGAIRFLNSSNLMSLEEIEEQGRATGFCMMCGRFLSNPESVERGIGPICAGKL